MKDKKVVKKTTKVEPISKPDEVLILKNQLARTLADYDNLRKRTDEEKIAWIKFSSQKVIQNLLPVLDNFENAQIHLKDQGLAIAISQFKDLLKQEGLVEISPSKGDEFDENFHEVIDVIEGEEKQNGKIADLLTRGWKFIDGLVVRHARVKVYKGS